MLHGVEVEGVAVAGECDVQVSSDYFARQHEVGINRRGWNVSKIALDLFNFFPSITAAQVLPVIGGGLQHGGSASVDSGGSSDVAEQGSFGRDLAGAGVEHFLKEDQQDDTGYRIVAEVADRQIEGAADGAKGVHFNDQPVSADFDIATVALGLL
jgi:hypothetical protein